MYPIDFFLRSARQYPERQALISSHQTLTYGQLAEQVNALACAFQAMDPDEGSRVGICAGNSVQHIVALLAVLAAGKVWVPLNQRNPAAELQRVIAFTEPTIVVSESAHVDALALDERISVVLTEGGDATARTLASAMAGHIGKTPEPHHRTRDEVQAIKFTGGSTGQPKGVMQPYRAWETSIVNQIHAFGFNGDDRYLICAPVTHGTSTYLLPILAEGGCLVLPASNKPPELLRCLREHGITTTFMPPTLMYMLMAEAGGARLELPKLRHLIYAGAPMPVEKIRLVRECFGPVLETSYGQTEAPQVVTVMRAEDFADEHNWRAVGRRGLLSDLAIMDPEGRLLAVGEVGEIVVRGDLIMAGYWRMPEKSAETIVDGWLHTGDRGYLDERGYLYLKDRLREVVITGGFNVYPIDVESVLDQHPAVHESAVFGIADDKWGEAVHAAVQLKPGQQVGEQELIAFAKQQLGSVKTPKRIHFYADLPRSVAGKVHKPTLKAEIHQQMNSKEEVA
ncbi:class I adenylate-forming enzyme family protein [Comamonas endophytica]|uniref:AMP-binding protein n=1 Tax=Comamonas endophytica TaxID=2949090 RepID=A0ABY6G9Z8_9BURK|nr:MULTISPECIES: AMP-binding protein [unclassified Acidovorax]MCD2514196.1 AMP-binding protein [Acidovorax sp. D4N7]UYG51334.1 AMP-binding protein [Acidovorax sp. 5MLIR]